MNVPYTRAPHQGGAHLTGADSPHAALLIDFDNVTMGMRSDLSKELKTLLDSDVIKGKVSVQRAYADWRRYPQYIVPLSEASVDLIFAPAYGSNKKNATDIRMAIDALELIFIRPEIGTFILLTGDSDFSSLVLKLKEYGKYVIGVGIQESSSDILVQNCDEYYSYTSLTGLTKTTELTGAGRDPWVLVKDAVAKMVQRNDVMRSDRLKQVMQEIDPAFDEGSIGFSKFSKFLAEASSRGLVNLRKLDNGQYEVEPTRRGNSSRSSDEGRGRRDRGRGGRRGGRDRGSRDSGSSSGGRTDNADASPAGEAASDGPTDPLNDAYQVLIEALTLLHEAGRSPARDSDVKRKMLESQPGFDETELGFPKFSKFLAQADEHGVVSVVRSDAGNLDVSLVDESGDRFSHDDSRDHGSGHDRHDSSEREDDEDDSHDAHGADGTHGADDTAGVESTAREASEPTSQNPDANEPSVIEVEPPKRGWFGLRLGPRRGSTRRRGADDAPTLLEGQVVDPQDVASSPTTTPSSSDPSDDAPPETEDSSDAGHREGAGSERPTGNGASVSSSHPIEGLGLPTDDGAIVRYLAHRYKGVGEKTAETLVEKLGTDIFRTLHEDPDAIARIVPPKRAEQVLDAWRADYDRRVASKKGDRS